MWKVLTKSLNFHYYLGPFCQINYLYEVSCGHPSHAFLIRYNWTRFHTSKKRFRKFQEAILLTVLNKIFELPLFLDHFCLINYLCEISSG